MEGVGYELSKLIAELGAGGGVDIPDCAVGSLCAQTDVEAAKFVEKVKRNYPKPLAKINASLKIVLKKTGSSYGYSIGVDADGVVHMYKGVPIQKILNIWNFGTADGRIERTRFWSKAIRSLKNKYDRAQERFLDLLDARFEGKVSHAKNTGTTVDSKIQAYLSHKKEYLNNDELLKVKILDRDEVRLSD